MSIGICNVTPTQSLYIVYNKNMKKTIFTSLIAILLISAPAYAENGSDLTASATKDTKEIPVIKEVAPKSKLEPLAIRRQKIEKDLRATVLKLQTVIDRTQVVIDLLNKNDKDTTDAAKFLSESQDSLNDATTALDIFSGVIIPEIKADPKATKLVEEKPAPASLKDPLKKAEDALKECKASLISSINALKEGLTPKDSSQ